MDEETASAQHRSRLTPEREGELFGAVLELLSATGYEALTMDAVAAKARTSKATIYRQWQGKPGLVAAAIRHMKESDDDYDTGSLHGDLVALAASIGKVAETNGQLLSAVSHAVQVDSELAEAMRECLYQPSNDKCGAILSRAIARGELTESNPAISYVTALFFQTIISSPVLEGRYVGAAQLTDLVETVILPALMAGNEAARKSDSQSSDEEGR